MIRLIEITDKTYRKGTGTMKENRYELNKQLAQMLKGGVIMDVTTPEQAKIAEEAGACAVMALERIPADIPRSRRRIPYERSEDDLWHSGSSIHTGYGKMQNRTFCRSADSGSN